MTYLLTMEVEMEINFHRCARICIVAAEGVYFEHLF
jgi:hypothetical protein